MPACSKWVANEWRRVWTDICLVLGQSGGVIRLDILDFQVYRTSCITLGLQQQLSGAIMFNGFKFTFAKNRVIMEIVHYGLVYKHLEPLMRDIAGNAANRGYAVSLLGQGAAKCKYSAAAAVFARLSALYEENPCNGLTAYDWELACHRALVLAGSERTEAQPIVDDLIQMNRLVNSEPLFHPPRAGQEKA